MCITFYDKNGNEVATYSAPNWDNLTEDEIFASGAWKDPIEARKLWNELKKSFEEVSN